MTLQKLKDISQLITDGTHYTPKSVESGIPFLSVKDMQSSGLDFEGAMQISAEDFQTAVAGNSAPRRGDVLFSKDGTVGKVHVVRDDREFAILSSIALIRPQHEVVDASYLGHALCAPSLLSAAQQRKTGSAVRRIILSDLKNLSIPLPSIAEQRRIAAILDDADQLRENRRQTLALLHCLEVSLFETKFGNRPENPSGFEQVHLVDICRPKQWPVISMKELTEFGYTVFGANGSIGFYDSYTHEAPTIAITCRGATCGTVNVTPPRTYINGNAMALDNLDTSRVTLEYLAAALRNRGFADVISGSAQPQITRQGLTKVTIPIPPLDDQVAFGEQLQLVQESRAVMTRQMLLIDELFASLQDRAFKGEL